MKNRCFNGLGGLLVCLATACPVLADEAASAPGIPSKGGGQAVPNKHAELGEMREWLNRRNAERKQLGLPGADMPKSHVAATHPRIRAGRSQTPLPAENAPEVAAAQERGTPVLHLGRGPDGRIRVRYILKEDGPDQLQVDSPDGYAPAEDAAKLDRLTPRGKQIWLSGSSLRTSGPRWLKKSLDPKVKD